MSIRTAIDADIDRLRYIRGAVRENVLRDPGRVTLKDYREHLGGSGQTWVFELEGLIVGFSAATLSPPAVWALFIDPMHERRGIGRQLLEHALSWLRDKGAAKVSLTTWPGTRAEHFYRAAGWSAGAVSAGNEISFTLDL